MQARKKFIEFPVTVDSDIFRDFSSVNDNSSADDEEMDPLDNFRDSLDGSDLNLFSFDSYDDDDDDDDDDDVLYGGPSGGDDVIEGGRGNDRLYGGIGNDTLEGGPGNDELYGGPDDDVLDGGEDDDRLTGGPGNDVFLFRAGDGEDTVVDFTDGEDRIDLTSFALTDIGDLTPETVSDGVRIRLSAQGGETILLEDVQIADLDATDFLL